MVIGSLARRVSNPNHFCRNAQSLISFSTSSGGRGRGRADGSPSPQFSFSARVLGQPSESESPPEGSSLGRGHGIAQPSSPVLPSFTSFVGPPVTAKSDDKENGGDSVVPGPVEEAEPDSFNVISALGTAGFGRGKPLKRESQAPGQEMNRHIRPERPRFENQINRNQAQPGPREAPIQEADRDARPQRPKFGVQDDMNRAQPVPSSSKSTPRPKMSKEDAVKNAKKILSRRDDDEDEEDYGPRGLRTGRGGSGRFRERDNRFDDEYSSVDKFKFDDEDEDEEVEKYDEKEEEKKRRESMIEVLGDEETYEELQNTIEELVEEFLPDEDELRAHDIDKSIEFEPEYAMEFNANPDIDEKPPVPLRDVFEKVKPFVMAYEGIESQEEWEQAIEETMKLAPTMKQLIDCYSGPDRVTSKQQVEELERVAKTLPQNATASVQRFTDRALLSLQSNPGWAFGKKAQFMDKLVREFSQQRK